jgi:hypothetical protein
LYQGLTNDIIIDTIELPADMEPLNKVIAALENKPGDIKFTTLCRICERFFGTARQKGSSHRVYKTPWKGDPRVNIQEKNGKAKTYQVRQIIKALKRLEADYGNKDNDK